MIYLIEPSNYDFHRNDLDDMYRLRNKIFYEKLSWNVISQNGMEKDEYDEQKAYYLIYKNKDGIIRGCVRFIEMINNCMFDNPFKYAYSKAHKFKRSGYWEVSRMAVDTTDQNYSKESMQKVCRSLLASLTYFGLDLEHVESFLTFSSPSTMRLYRQYGLIIAPLNEIETQNGVIVTWCFHPLHYSYDQLLSYIDFDSSKPILKHLGSMYKNVSFKSEVPLSFNHSTVH